jgi:hypothetical protein
MSRATFSRMEDSTAQDWRVIGGEFAEFSTCGACSAT